ncbi:hypothetical protein I5H06_gp48 [Mycobacterium phage SirPhilip]|uniref:Uncharacterized protein n=1 Tax=Mycobacterium phage SirPhilip TaxID=2015824 RepID=A0A222ZKJ3_9CAUD|nr:hypothetical protein I5H06_gp48 [Mycobacterium phage SirPhilip]ASR85256.1 hypothetical protein SEA_SIRPHILIP_54 [Mycobacterium phage SirPhilip]
MSTYNGALCEVCGKYDAQVFDPCGAMWCRVCDLMGLGELAVRERLADDAEAGPSPVVLSTEPYFALNLDYAAINRKWREQAGEPNDADSLDDADKAYVWEDADGVHWGWLEHNGWVAWGTSKVSVWGRPAAAPFTVAYKRTDEFAPRLSNAAGVAPTSDDAEASNAEGDAVEHPSHYTSSPARCKGCGRPIECIDITEHMGFCLGNTVKYVWRCDLKLDAIEDLRKAKQYIEFEIDKRERALVDSFKNRNTTKG